MMTKMVCLYWAKSQLKVLFRAMFCDVAVISRDFVRRFLHTSVVPGYSQVLLHDEHRGLEADGPSRETEQPLAQQELK